MQVINDVREQEIIEIQGKLQNLASQKLLSAKGDIIFKVNTIGDFNDVSQIIRDKFELERSKLFIINKGITKEGKVTNPIKPFKQKVCLYKVFRTEDKREYLKFFNEKVDRNEIKDIIDTAEEEFWMYRFVSSKKEYLILSLEELNLEEYKIEGMLVEVGDFTDIGNYTKLGTKIPIIFVNSAKKCITEFKDHKTFFKFVNKFNFDEDSLMKYIFSLENKDYFRHPRYFERMVTAFLFSTKFDSSPYPLHLLMVGEPGSGKSKVMECLHWKFNEANEITDGSCSTIKALVPSFKSTISIKTGDLIEANRLNAVDEFLRVLVRIPSDEREHQLAILNPLLEHKRRRFSSGNQSYDSKMTSKLLSASNPIYGSSTMDKLCSRIDRSFVSRLLIYYQDNKHLAYINELKMKENLEKCVLNIKIKDWLSIYDYFNSFKASIDFKEIDKIFKDKLKWFGVENKYDDVKGVYLARYRHHLMCLADGIIKIRCLCEKDEEIKGKEQDYKLIDEIWTKIIENWGCRIHEFTTESIS